MRQPEKPSHSPVTRVSTLESSVKNVHAFITLNSLNEFGQAGLGLIKADGVLVPEAILTNIVDGKTEDQSIMKNHRRCGFADSIKMEPAK